MIEDAAQSFLMYDIRSVTPETVRLADVCVACAEKVQAAVIQPGMVFHVPITLREYNKFTVIIVVTVGTRIVGLVVDALIGQQEIVVKQFDAVRNAATLFSGATILGDGAPALIVDVGSLI